MFKKLLFLVVMLLPALSAQPFGQANSSFTAKFTETTVAALPASGNWVGRIFIVTDGDAASLCGTGSSTKRAFCTWDGDSWEPFVAVSSGGSEINDLEGTAPTAILTTEIPIGTGAGTLAFAPLSGDATMSNTGVVTVVDDLHAHTGTSISALDTADVTTGTWADARVAVGNVTQHVASIDHNALLNFSATKHIDHAASATSAFVQDGGVTALTCGASNQGRMQILDAGTLQVCDGAVTSVLRTFTAGAHTSEINDLTAAVTWANVPDANITVGSVTQHIASIDHDATLNFVAGEHVDHTASATTNFVQDGGVTSLTCGASNQGRMQVLDDGTLQICDGATTSVLRSLSAGAGSGDFVGPASSTDNAFVRFDLATGKLGQNSLATLDDNGFPTWGIGTTTGWARTTGGAGDTGASSHVIEGGDVSGENANLGLVSGEGDASYIGPSGDGVAGHVQLSPTLITADSTDWVVTQANATCVDSVGTDSYACAPAPSIGAYVDGHKYRFKAGTANTGAATLALNGLSALAINKHNDQALETGDIEAGQWVEVVYNGTDLEMVSQKAVDDGGAETNSLETLTTGIQTTEIPIGTAANTLAFAALSGDATMSNTGAVTLAATITRDTEWDTLAEINAATTDDDAAGLAATNAFTGTPTFSNATYSALFTGGNVGLGTATPNASSVLDLTSTTGALLIPRMTTTQRNALTAVNGMLIYDSTLNGLQGYKGGAWGTLGGASSQIHFAPEDASFPITSSAALQCVESSATAPRPKWCEVLFTTGERVMWSGRLPENFATATTATLGVMYKMVSATTNNVEWTAAIACITPGDAQDSDANAFATNNVSADDAIPGTAGYIAEHTWSLTNTDSCAANDLFSVYLERSTPTGTDATGEVELVNFYLEFTP